MSSRHWQNPRRYCQDAVSIRISTWNRWLSWVEGRRPPVLSRVDRYFKVDCRIGLIRHIVGNIINVIRSSVAAHWPYISGYPHVWVSKTAFKEEDIIWRIAFKYWWAQIEEVRLVRLLLRRKRSDSVGLSRTLGELDVHPLFFRCRHFWQLYFKNKSNRSSYIF